jgi:CubicO group peptidase (beta-lactamase class C family)
MDNWLRSAIGYIGDWLEFQLAGLQQPGVTIAIAHRGEIISEKAFGFANLDTEEKLTPRHRFRIASHSKSFTAAGIMKLREQKKLRLDDPIGKYVGGLHPDVAEQTIAQALSHSAGLTRDGVDSGQFTDSRSYLNKKELLEELAMPPAIEPNTRFKYSNHGFALVGLVIEAITGEPYPVWIKREIVDVVGLKETDPGMPRAKGTPFARGHTLRRPLGRRLVIPGDNPAHAMTSAAGFVSTAADTARYFAQLAPNARKSAIAVASRREMTRRHWRVPGNIELHYGLGVAIGKAEGFEWFGHGGGFQGYLSRTAVIPESELAITLLSNSIDGWAPIWMEGCFHILRAFKSRGAPERRVRDWTGRWWTIWNAVDLVPMGDRVLVGNPHMISPFLDAAEIEVTGRDTGRITSATGYASFGEPARRSRNKSGKVSDIWLGGANFKTERAISAEIERRYARGYAKGKRRS